VAWLQSLVIDISASDGLTGMFNRRMLTASSGVWEQAIETSR
jgi:hypothetical protein